MGTYKKDDLVELTIEDIGVGGEGIGKVDGYTVFVKDTVIGDVIKAKIIKAKKNYGYGRLVEIIKASLVRVEPVCKVARQCGGCQIQQMSYEAQLEFKQKLVRDNLTRIGGISDYEEFPVIGMETPYHYRNKAQYPVGLDKDGNIVMGFYAGRTHSIIPCTDCAIGAKGNSEILEIIRKWMLDKSVKPYDEKSGNGLIRHILIRTGFHTKQIMVCLIVNATDMKAFSRALTASFDKNVKKSDIVIADLVDKLQGILGMTSIMVNFNDKDTNVILGKSCECLWGKEYIEDYIGDILYQISPLSFFQVNPEQTEKLYGKALEFAGLKGGETVWDLYCGIGTISLFLAGKAKKVYGVEIVPEAIEDARNNAKINNIDNVEFIVGKAEEVVPAFYDRVKNEIKSETNDDEVVESIHPDVVVVDPPRKGCDEVLLNTVIKMSPDRIVYVSCDSATLARDLRVLEDNGYKVKKVQPVDQFGHSVHVECVTLIQRVNS